MFQNLVLDATNQPWADLLGSGTYGEAYRLADGNVAKVTTSDIEYEAALAAMSPAMQAIDFTPKIYMAQPYNNVYVIVRESLGDLTVPPKVSHALGEATTRLETVDFEDMIDAADSDPTLLTELEGILAERAYEELESSKLKDKNKDMLMELLDNILDMSMKYARLGIKLHDLHENNFGLRGAQMVVRDLGVFVV